MSGCARVSMYVCKVMLAEAELPPATLVMMMVCLCVSPVSGQP